MKRALCIMIGLIMITSVVYSKEIGPGTISLSGTTGMGFTKTTTSAEDMDDLDTDVLSLEVNGEYYIMPNLGIGLIFSYSSVKQDYPVIAETEVTIETAEMSTMMVGPQVVYNISVNEQVSVPIFAALGSVSIDEDGEDISGWAWAIGGGLRYFVSDHVSFDGYLVYDSMSLEDGVKLDMTDMQGRVGISIYLGGE
jgi:opacity protein-like surface antigen